MRYCLIICTAIILALFSGCSENTPPITFDKMKAIMMDLHTAEVNAALDDSTKNLSKKKDYAVLSDHYAGIFAHYRVSESQFEAALNWYFNHPELFDSIYKMMITQVDSLEQLSDTMTSPKGSVRGTDSSSESAEAVMDKERESMLQDPRPLPGTDPPQQTRPELQKMPEKGIK